MYLKKLVLAGAVSLMGTSAFAGCAFENSVPLKSLTAGFDAWKAVTDAMSECGNFQAELDQEFRTKQPAAFEANPALYHIGGVSNGTVTPLLNAGTIRPLDDLVAKYGQNLKPNQLIKVNGKTTVDLKIEDEKKLFLKGHLAIQQHDPGSVVKVRKVEVKELKK